MTNDEMERMERMERNMEFICGEVHQQPRRGRTSEALMLVSLDQQVTVF